MTETILIPFVSPDCAVINSYPYKFILNDNSFEFFAKHTVEEIDDATELKVVKKYDTRIKIIKDAIGSFEMYKSVDYPDMFVFKLNTPSGEISMYVEDKLQATDLYNKFDKWIFDANS